MCKVLKVCTLKKLEEIVDAKFKLIKTEKEFAKKTEYEYNIISNMCACDFFNKKLRDYNSYQHNLKNKLIEIDSLATISQLIFFDENLKEDFNIVKFVKVSEIFSFLVQDLNFKFIKNLEYKDYCNYKNRDIEN